MRVLIADDSTLFRERLIDLLAEYPNIEVVGEAGNVEETERLIPECKPDAVILDIRMPGGNGIDVLKTIRRRNPGPGVIVMTNYPYPQYMKKCLDLGADYFFVKSTDFEKIPAALEELPHNRPAQV